MKTVFTKRELPHYWALQNQQSGQTPTNNFSFRGPVLTSYATPIAVMASYRGEPVCIMTSHSYSVTTNSQLSLARQALPPSVRLIYIDTIPREWSSLSDPPSPTEVARVLREESDRLKSAALDAYRSAAEPKLRANSIAARLRYADSVAAKYDSFNAANGIRRKPYDRPTRETMGELSAKVARADALAEKRRIANEKRAKAKAVAIYTEALALWRQGERFSLPSNPFPGRFDLLRLRPDSDSPDRLRIETSQGLRIPTTRATVHTYVGSIVETIRAKLSGVPVPDATAKLGAWRIGALAFGDDGYLAVGCHRFAWLELLAFLRLLESADLLSPEEATQATEAISDALAMVGRDYACQVS